MAYRVAEGTQVAHDGKLYASGQTVPLDADADAETIAYLLNAGWVVETKSAAKKAPSAT